MIKVKFDTNSGDFQVVFQRWYKRESYRWLIFWSCVICTNPGQIWASTERFFIHSKVCTRGGPTSSWSILDKTKKPLSNFVIRNDKITIDIILKKLLNGGRNTSKENMMNMYCIQTHSLFLSNKHKEIQYRILHRQNRTPHVMNKSDPSRSPLCLKCNWSPGTHIHCL